MKRCLYPFLALMIMVSTATAQEEELKLTVPSSPAFSILNFEPSSVMKPTSNKDLAADILNAFDKDGKLLMNLGLEVSPYWLQSRPRLTREQYLRPNFGQTLLQSLSISAATVKDSASGAHKLGTGFRFKVLNGSPLDTLYSLQSLRRNQQTITGALNAVRGMVATNSFTTKEECIEAVMEILNTPDAGLTLTTEEIARFKTMAEDAAANYTGTSLTEFMNTLIQRQVSSYDGLVKKLSEVLYLRKGWVIEFAGASAFNTTENNSIERMGVWGNASNYISASELVTLSARVMWRNNRDTAMTNADLGLAYLKQGSTFNISVEAMLRWYTADIPDFNIGGEPIKRVERKFTYRLAATGSYIITRDLSVNLTIGKNFDDPYISGSSFFSILGFNYSIFNKQQVTE